MIWFIGLVFVMIFVGLLIVGSVYGVAKIATSHKRKDDE